MKLASFVADGKPACGVVTDGGIVTIKGRYVTIDDVIAAGAFDEVRRAADGATPDRDVQGLQFLPTITRPGKILCVGINYASHAAEHGGALEKPNIFTKFVDCLAAHEGEIWRPKASVQFDFEGELVVVIGRGGRAIPTENALSHVAGYTCFCDGSVRDFIKMSLITGKNFPMTSPLGPWMVTADEIPDPSQLTLTTRLNGVQMQHARTDLLIHDVPALIAYCSTFTRLAPGDIIATGTPEGVGAKRNPPVWMKAGDVLEVEISGIGTLRSRVVDEP
jgi:2-keto-4-pentenoate hydratase/2-oxohepta-3-ene-1,7-dioic acid hydratase in catechol pathway